MLKSRILKINIILLLAGLIFASLYFISSAKADSGKHIVKWVDAQGVTHYGDKLPSQEAGRNNTEINNQGIVVKRNVQTDKNNQAKDEEKLAAQRKDSILLSSYTKVEEIDLARDRNLQMDQASLTALSAQKDSLAGRSARNQKTADDFRQRKKPVPDYLNEELKLSQAEASKVDKQIAERKLSMEATRKHYADEKARFTALKQVNSPDASPAPAEAPKPEAAANPNQGLVKTLSTNTTPAKTK